MKVTKLLLYLTILSIPLGQLGRIPIGDSATSLYVTDLLVALTVFVWLVGALAIRRSLELPPLAAPIALFAAVSLLSLINGARYLETAAQFLSSTLYWIRWIMYTGVYFVARDLNDGPEFGTSTPRYLIVSGFILALLGFAQLAIFPDFSTMTSEGWDPHLNRLLSTFFDPNFCGAYLVLTLCLLLPSLSSCAIPASPTGRLSRPEKDTQTVARGQNRILRLQSLIAAGVVAAALLLTFSRSAWLMAAAAVGVVAFFRSKKLLILAIVLAFSAYFFVPRVQTRIAGGVDPDDSAQARIVNWKQSLEVIKDNWLIGVGFNSYRYAQARYGNFDWSEPLGGRSGAGADSSLLLVLATTGVSGLLAYLWVYAKALWPKTKKLATRLPARQAGNWRPACRRGRLETGELVLLASLAGLLIESNFINSLFYPPIMLWLWITMGSLTPTEA